jgi:protein-S-isoprenylcysteine O-methyltransferase Ste14
MILAVVRITTGMAVWHSFCLHIPSGVEVLFQRKDDVKKDRVRNIYLALVVLVICALFFLINFKQSGNAWGAALVTLGLLAVMAVSGLIFWAVLGAVRKNRE